MACETLTFFVNGKKVEDPQVDPTMTLLVYLRTKLRLCGTKLGCGVGACGACTVMVTKYDRIKAAEIHYPRNSCITPVCSMQGLAVTTIEGIGSVEEKLHPTQERIAKAHGTQCGFCTPGIVMSIYTLLRNKPKPTMEEIESSLQGNLCRCTGYRSILDGYKSFTEDDIPKKTGECAMGENCCRLQNSRNSDEGVLFEKSDFAPYDPSQEPIFPPELKLTDKYDKQYLKIKGRRVTWYRPVVLDDLLQLKHEFPHAKIVVGNTAIGVEIHQNKKFYPILIDASQIPEMSSVSEDENGIRIGASTTIFQIEELLENQLRLKSEVQTRIFKAMLNMIKVLATKPIKSVGSIGGNIMNGSPVSDIVPILMAGKAIMEVISKANGRREVILDNKFFVGHMENTVKTNEVLISIMLPFSVRDQYFVAYKLSRRRYGDVAIVNVAMNVVFEDKSNTVDDICIAFGGMSDRTVLAQKTAKNLKGLPWNRETLEKAYIHLLEDYPLDPGALGGMIQYRKSLTLSLFFKIFLKISKEFQNNITGTEIDNRELCGLDDFGLQELRSSQYFTLNSKTMERGYSVPQPAVTVSAYKQATGEAVYVDDMPIFENELYMAFVTSTRAHARIISVDAAEALATDGVEDFITFEDLKNGRNLYGPAVRDQKIFYNDEVTSQGQIIGAILAVNKQIAQDAANKVKVEYEDLLPLIITIEDAIKNDSYFEKPSIVVIQGDIDKVLSEASHVIEGEIHIGGQEHFYLETNSVLVVPKKENGEMDIYSSTQNPSEITQLIAEALGVHQNKIITKVKRLGGGFGGKETQAAIIAIPAAIAAAKLKRPVRVKLDRDEDMIMTGGRHPFLFKYKIGFNGNGKILGCDMNIYNNCGFSLDLSIGVIKRAMLLFQSSYKVSTCRVICYPCKTNIQSNTAFRGFGGPQGMFAGETMIRDIADYFQKDPVEISELNLYKEGDMTHYDQILENCTLGRCWEECMTSSNYAERRKAVNQFNIENKLKKRGITVLPITFGIGYTATFMNQSGALVLVYTDGSVLLSHGGVEMGQGLYTKMVQVAATALNIPLEKIHTLETATDKVPNTPATAASAGSDINGMAVLNACNIINERLAPYKKANPAGTWENWVTAAYYDRVNLSATGFYKTPDVGHDWEKNTGRVFDYYTYGAACSEVEIDPLTGDHQIIRTDIVMDLGESLNPAIDIGQIEGAFVQGYGLFVLEEIVYSPDGRHYTTGPGTYKIPTCSDIPGVFNVTLLKGSSNPRAVYSSKGVGEPPLFAGCSVLFAIREAIKAARTENGVTESFKLDAPATAERIRMLCRDSITDRIKIPTPGSYKPWSVRL